MHLVVLFLQKIKPLKLLVPRVTFNINDEILNTIIFNAKRGFLSKLNHISDPKGYVEMDPITLNKLNKEYSIVAPLKDKKRVIGAIILLDKELRTGKSAFTSNDSSMLAAIAAQASVAYSNNSSSGHID